MYRFNLFIEPCSITIPSSSGTSYLSDETPLDAGRHSIQHGRHLRIVCQDGYRLKGYDDDIVCDRSTMSGSISWCVERKSLSSRTVLITTFKP